MAYSLTKIEVKEDKGYQKYIRLSSKILLISVLFFLILGIVGVVLNFPSPFFSVTIVWAIIVGILFFINDWIFYLMTYRYVKKVRSKMTPEEKRKQIIYAIICIILGLALWWVIKHALLK